MANPWFRLYAEFSHDPKIQIMPEAMQRRYVMLMCLRCSNDLETLHETELGFHLRISEAELAETKALFLAKGFIDEDWNLLNWDKRQFGSDSSTARVRKFREQQKRNSKPNETPPKRFSNAPDTDTDSETEKDKDTTRAGASDEITPSMIATGVMVEAALSGRDLRNVLEDIIRSESRLPGATPETIRDAMVAAWRDYAASKSALTFTWGAAKFFGEGNWKQRDAWPWKQPLGGGSNGHQPYLTKSERNAQSVINSTREAERLLEARQQARRGTGDDAERGPQPAHADAHGRAAARLANGSVAVRH